MPEARKYYVFSNDGCKFESMTKEEILAAITQAVESHSISDVDTGFVTTIKEQNNNAGMKVWRGTQAQYNALQEIDPDCYYIITDSSEISDIEEDIASLNQSFQELSEPITEIYNFVTPTEARKNAVLYDQEIAYGQGVNVRISTTSDKYLKEYSIIRVTVESGEEVLCCVAQDETSQNYYRITGSAPADDRDYIGIISVYLLVNGSNNVVLDNYSESVYLSTGSTTQTHSNLAIEKITGIF